MLNRLRNPVFAAIACVGLAMARVSASASSLPVVSIRGEDTGAIVYDYAREHCAVWDTPDAPLRAFRDAHGGVVAFVSDSMSRRFHGTTLLDIHHSCHSSLTSQPNPDPSAYAGSDYVTATWTADGTTVMALLHEEYHAEQFPGACRYTESMQCWYNTILAARSLDGGLTFVTTRPPTLVAAAAFRQDVEQGRHRGFFNPSNILFHDGFYYMMTGTTGGGPQKDGLCLFRTATIDDAASWRGFDGHGYTARAIDPYRESTQAAIPCEPVDGPGTVGSISWHAASGLFLIVSQAVDAARPTGYTAYAWSKDLIHWSEPRRLYDHPDLSSANCADRFRYGYPSVADPGAPGRNFDSIGAHPVLFLTRFHVVNCELPPNRDLIRLELDVVE
jgi:hypothetical protein